MLSSDQVDVARSKISSSDQVDGARSITLSSGKVFDNVCGPCKLEGKANEARKYCEECAESLCDSCANTHQKFPLMKNHKIVDVAALSRRKVNVILADDKFAPDITGCVFMSNGTLIICDYYNNKIKLFDGSLSLKDSLKLSHGPWDVSLIDAATVIVTVPGLKQLQLIQVFPQLKLNHVIQLDERCWGVAVSGQEIYVSCHSGYFANDCEVRVLDKQGQLKSRLGNRWIWSNLFSLPFYITVNTAGDKIFVSDRWGYTVTCMKVDGSVVYQYHDADLNKPHGLICDDGDNLVVCGFISNNIHVITSDGKKYDDLLSSENGLVGPWCVAYRKSDDTLVVGCDSYDLFVSHVLK